MMGALVPGRSGRIEPQEPGKNKIDYGQTTLETSVEDSPEVTSTAG